MTRNNSIDMLSYFDYTSVGGELTAGDGETRTAVSSSAFLTLDGVPVQATCYNIDGNNYFKLRDITDVLDCRVDWEEKNQTIWIIPGMTAYDDPNEAVADKIIYGSFEVVTKSHIRAERWQ